MIDLKGVALFGIFAAAVIPVAFAQKATVETTTTVEKSSDGATTTREVTGSNGGSVSNSRSISNGEYMDQRQIIQPDGTKSKTVTTVQDGTATVSRGVDGAPAKTITHEIPSGTPSGHVGAPPTSVTHGARR